MAGAVCICGVWHRSHSMLLKSVAAAEPVRVRVKLREDRIEFAETDDRRAIHYLGAVIAGRFQLPGAIDALHEGDELVGPDLRASRRIWADHRRMGDGYASELELACRVLDPAS